MNDGWRGKLGFLTPAPGVSSSDEIREMCPVGVLPMIATTTVRRSTAEGVLEALSHLEDGTEQLVAASVDVIVQVAAMPSIALGPKDDEQMIERIHRLTDVPVILSMRAAVDALKEFGIGSVAAIHPLAKEIAPLAGAYLEAHGMRLLASPVLGLTSSSAVHELNAGSAYSLARQAVREAPDAEAILLLGGGWRTLEIIDPLEADTGKLVVSTNAAMIWAALRTLGVRAPQSGFGSLLAGQ